MPDSAISASRFLVSPLRRHVGACAASLGLGFSTVAATLGLSASAAWLIVRAAQRPTVFSLAIVMGCVQLFALSRAATRYLERLATHNVALRLLHSIRINVFSALERVVPGAQGSIHDHDLTAMAINDVDAVEHLYVAVLPPLLTGAFGTLCATAIALRFSLLGAGVLFLGLVTNAVILPLAANRLANAPTRELERLAAHSRQLIDTLVGSGLELSTSPALASMFEDLRATEVAIEHRALQLAIRRGAISACTVLVSGLSVGALGLIGINQVRTGHLDVAAIAVLPLLGVAALEIVGSFALAATVLPRDLSAAGRLAKLLDRPPSWPEPATPQTVPDPVAELRLAHTDIGFDNQRPVLSDVTMLIEQGARIGIVGRSGSGKSTLLNLLARFVPPLAGSVTLNGIELDELQGSDVRSRVVTVDQEPHLFHTSLCENVRLAQPLASDDEVTESLMLAGLAEVIESSEAGIYLDVGAAGGRLSGGERQRVALARLLLRDPEIAIFDEATDGLDDLAATAVMERVSGALLRRSMIIVTHRDSDLALAHKRYEVVGGQVLCRSIPNADAWSSS